jgi:SAM-dependent MidA family methyltransferase
VTEFRPQPVIPETFPEPDAESLALSDELTRRIRAEILAAGGWIGFERFMQMALFEPGLGYYSAGSAKLGPSGDFTTAPELSRWFAAAIAPLVAATLAQTGGRQILELGGGTGRLALQILGEFKALGRDIDYTILEVSADLRERQQSLLEPAGAAVSWIETLPEQAIDGVIIANEVIDCLPVARFQKTGGTVLPLGVTADDGTLAVAAGPFDAKLAEAVGQIEADVGYQFPDGYRSEVCLALGPWLSGVLGALSAGGVLLIDYGLPRRDYYRPHSGDGTLICHYRHRAHDDPLLWPGLQDISAWVDFTAVAGAARDNGAVVTGYTNQAQFLISSLADDTLSGHREISPEEASALKTLTLPGEMGERFKLMWMTTPGISVTLPGRDFRDWL